MSVCREYYHLFSPKKIKYTAKVFKTTCFVIFSFLFIFLGKLPQRGGPKIPQVGVMTLMRCGMKWKLGRRCTAVCHIITCHAIKWFEWLDYCISSYKLSQSAQPTLSRWCYKPQLSQLGSPIRENEVIRYD